MNKSLTIAGFDSGAFRSQRRERGFNMVEVLVALAVLAVGLLGLAGLQSIGMRLNYQSYQRTQAVIQAYDLADRIRANWRCVPDDTCAYSNVSPGNIPAIPPVCISATGAVTCSQYEMATYDIAQWNTQNARLLTNGRGAVCRGSLDNNLACTIAPAGIERYSIAVAWIENDLNMRIDIDVPIPRKIPL